MILSTIVPLTYYGGVSSGAHWGDHNYTVASDGDHMLDMISLKNHFSNFSKNLG